MPGIHSHFKHRGTNRLLELTLTQVNRQGWLYPCNHLHFRFLAQFLISIAM
jgi:hypothetical protein